MSDKLKEFVDKHRNEFDTEEPSKDLWKKIDSQNNGSTSASNSSKWISKIKYLGFGASILLVTVYFILREIGDSTSVALTQNNKDSALNSSGQWIKANQNNSDETQTENNISSPGDNEKKLIPSDQKNKQLNSSPNQNNEMRRDTVSSIAENNSDNKIKQEDNYSISVPKEEKVIPTVASTSKRKKITIPEEPSDVNHYSGTIYSSSSLCSVVQAYKFPGKVNMDDESNFTGHRTLKTMPCSRMEDMENIKAVWIKGKTSKKFTLALNEGLKNIVLHKSDGRKIYPVAISHYYKGLGVISDYSGRHFDMTFKDKVELILFFKDAEEGDKVIIDGTLEAVLKNSL